MIATHPALSLLIRRKFQGAVRKQARRLRSVQGVLLALIGGTAILLWLGTALFNSFHLGRGASPPIEEPIARLVGMLILVMSLVGALNFRGLYLPREEIELLFTAPVPRADVVRYRLLNSLLKSALGALFFALIVMGRVHVPAFGFFGGLIAMLTLPIVAQVVSLFAGDAENRWLGRLPRGVLRVVNVLGVLLILALIFRSRDGGPVEDESGAGPLGAAEFVLGLVDHPAVRAVTLVVWPWARMCTTDSGAEFALLALVCVSLWFLGFEACARLRIDYRELSLETSADVARRLARMRRGGSAASGSTAKAGWRIPWLFGRGPFGALAWRKTGTMLRKARGTTMVSALMVGVLILLTRGMFDGGTARETLGASLVIGFAGTVYLCSGLRFDFREDLDRMDVVRSWPIAPWRVFLATLLPETAFVAGLLAVAIAGRALWMGGLSNEVVYVILGLPSIVLGWISIDNIVFLFWPQRLTPGAEGLLQTAGRSMLLGLLRVLAGLLGAGLALGAAWLVHYLSGSLPAAALVALLLLASGSAALVAFGGFALSRFDVARDR